jgi:lipoyl(octanoyl) transferase
MERRVADIGEGRAGELVWLLEHPGLLTAGTSARDADLIDAGGLDVHRVGRGGQWTYHGPGQRIGYVMLDLRRPHGTVAARDVRAFVGGLEAWLIAALATFEVVGELREGRIGIWVVDPATGAESKIAALGVRVTRWVSWHGVALNVAPDLSEYRRIVPCGIEAHGVTSLAALGVQASMGDVDAALLRCWTEVFGVLPQAPPRAGPLDPPP